MTANHNDPVEFDRALPLNHGGNRRCPCGIGAVGSLGEHVFFKQYARSQKHDPGHQCEITPLWRHLDQGTKPANKTKKQKQTAEPEKNISGFGPR